MMLRNVILTLVLFSIASCGRYTEATSPCFGTKTSEDAAEPSLSFLATSPTQPDIVSKAEKDCVFSELPAAE